MTILPDPKYNLVLELERSYTTNARKILLKRGISLSFFVEYILKELATGNPQVHNLLDETVLNKTDLISLKQNQQNGSEEILYNLIEQHLKNS